MNAIQVTEVVANEGLSCAFKTEHLTLGVARRLDNGLWQLRLSCGREFACEDFDEMRHHIRAATPGGNAFFERRRICVRHHFHGRLAA